jgi:GT2 family glycosyltransferase
MQSLLLVSVIIVTWNSKKYLLDCLEHLLMQTFRDFEVILVDNGSEDGALDGLHKKYPSLDLHIHRLSSNRGFAVANNIGVRLARGKWLALLNADAFPNPDWLEQLLKAVEDNPEFSFFASCQLQANQPELLDGAGDAYHVSGLAWQRYHNYPTDQFGLESEEVFGACAAAAIYSCETFLQVGGFDEDFFSYHEDVDLSFRLRLQGFRCLYVPQAKVAHVGSASTGARSDFWLYHWQRNYVWSFFQNMPSVLLWEALPAHLMANFSNVLNYARRKHGRTVLKAKIDALRGLQLAFEKRRRIQSARRINDDELLHIMERGWLKPYSADRDVRKTRMSEEHSRRK